MGTVKLKCGLQFLLPFACLIFVVSGCTKGSSDSSEGSSNTDVSAETLVNGRWFGTIQKRFDTCSGLPDPSSFSFTHEITQDDDRITLEISGGSNHLLSDRTHRGSFISSNSFLADARNGIGGGCELQDIFEYQEVIGNDATVIRRLLQNCNGSVRCQAQYEGSASR